MIKNRIGEFVFDWSKRIAQGMALHFLWLAFTLCGLVVFGLFPATAALYGVIRKRFIYKEEVPLFKTFFNTYKTKFIELNLLMSVFAIIGLFLYADFIISSHFIQSPILHILLLGIILVYGLMLIFFFPVYSHFNLSKWTYLKQSLLLPLARPGESLLAILAVGVLWTFSLWLPVLFLFIGASLVAYPLAWIAFRAFGKLEAAKGTGN
ncbi:putative membrane protein YesL [Scopulibacillus darangshiensis]|uniref:Putative membrane protein YesL n=1 Tax=Scopulibacillus darangshiensis TaxID=442528 RepID=A0A4R2NVF4_9BACL|nr:DUF624 domain-containing protein [Scopulibacillus darangshiensis]TCP25980.1 putative membrane protein YesL [Scopulibacillus darangshiensis]